MQIKSTTQFSLAENETFVYQLISHPQSPGIFAAAASDQTIKLYNSDTLELLSQLNGGQETGQIREISFLAQDCNSIVCAFADSTIKVFDIRQQNAVFSFQGNPYQYLHYSILNYQILKGRRLRVFQVIARVILWLWVQKPSRMMMENRKQK